MNPITAILGLVDTVVSRIFPDKTAADKAALTFALQQEINQSNLLLEQGKANTAAAASPNLFVAGARPFMLWVCGFTFAWEFVLRPILSYLIVTAGHPLPVLPTLDMGQLMPVLMGLLGLGGLRTYERVKGVIPPGR